MKSEVIPFCELGAKHDQRPGVFPVFGKIRKINGLQVGEVIGYSDAYGRRIHMEKIEDKVYQ